MSLKEMSPCNFFFHNRQVLSRDALNISENKCHFDEDEFVERDETCFKSCTFQVHFKFKFGPIKPHRKEIFKQHVIDHIWKFYYEKHLKNFQEKQWKKF